MKNETLKLALVIEEFDRNNESLPLELLKPIAETLRALAQRTWQGLTDEDKKQIAKEANYHWEMTAGEYAERIGQLTEAKLKEKNSA